MTVILILIILILIIYTWEFLLMLSLLCIVLIIAYKIYKIRSKHSILWMYLWLTYGGFAFLLICLPITQSGRFIDEATWLEKLYNTRFLSRTKYDCEKYTTFILDKQLNESKIHPSGESYKRYNRIASQDAEKLYLDFRVGMSVNAFYEMNKSDYAENSNFSNTYYNNPYDYFNKYELIDGVNFELDGLFIRKRLQGVVLSNGECDFEDRCLRAEKLADILKMKYGSPLETIKDSTSYIAKWLFDDKHIIVVSTSDFDDRGEMFFRCGTYGCFTGVVIYNPHKVIPLIEEEIHRRNDAKIAAKEQKRRMLQKQQEEQRMARQREISDSISAEKKKLEIQNGF